MDALVVCTNVYKNCNVMGWVGSTMQAELHGLRLVGQCSWVCVKTEPYARFLESRVCIRDQLQLTHWGGGDEVSSWPQDEESSNEGRVVVLLLALECRTRSTANLAFCELIRHLLAPTG
jgi:hypothetical protein